MHSHEFQITLEFAFLLGVIHALEPGHGKTAMLVYLLGEKRNPWQPVIMGLSTAISHCISLFAIAFAVHLAHHVVTGDHHHEETVSRLLPWVSAVMIISVGLLLLYRAIRGRQTKCCQHDHAETDHLETAHHASEHHHENCGCGNLVQLNSTACSTAEIAETDTKEQKPKSNYKTTALLGMAVGLLPCPSALAAYFSSLSTSSTAAAYLIIALFAAGIACSLVVVGFILQHFGEKFGHKLMKKSRFPWAYAQALFILCMGIFYSIRLITPDI